MKANCVSIFWTGRPHLLWSSSSSFKLFVESIYVGLCAGEDVYTAYTALALTLGLRVFGETGPPRREKFLASPRVCNIKIEASLEDPAQGYNKLVCWFVHQTIPILLSAK